MSPANKAHFEAEKEAIHLILTGIGDDIYSTVDACQTAQKCGKLSKGYNKPEWSRLARNANPLALVATGQANQDPYYQTSKSRKSHAPSSKPSIPTRAHTTTRHKGKEIAKPSTSQSETASEEDNNPEQAQRDKDITSSNSRNKNVDTTPRYKNDNQFGKFGNQRTVNVAGARENVGSPVVQQSGIQCFNCKEFGHFAKECGKPKKVKDFVYHKEKMLLCKQAEQGVPLQAEQYDWLADTDEEIDDQELEAHYNYMAKIQEVPTADSGTNSEPLEQVQNDAGYNMFANDLQHYEQSKSISNTCLVERDDSNVIPDSSDMYEDDIQNDKNDVESDDERVALANLIANLKLDVDENKKIQKQLKKANTTFAQELKECKTILAETSNALGESISVQDSFRVALQTKQTEFEKYKAFNDHTVDYEKLELWNEQASNVFRKEHEQYNEIQDLKAQLQDKNIAISELKKLIEKSKGKYVDTKFDKPSVVRQPNAQRILKPSVLVDSNHFACVTKMLNDINARTKKPNVVPISTRKPKSQANKSVATPYKNKVASKSTNQKPQSYYRMLYEKISKTWKWWIAQQSPSGYKWIVQLILFIIDSGCTKHMTGNLKLLCNFVEKFLGTVRFGNDQFSPILGYGELVQINVTINRVYYVDGLNHNLFSVGQFCDADLEVAFQKSTCFVRDLQGNDLLTDVHVPSQQELDLLFGPLYDECFNAGSNPQDKQPIMNIQHTSTPSTPTYVHAEKNNDDQACNTPKIGRNGIWV
nr:integrase, catalytic region, zinc finger, CCHC-type, peptidase aspartic, catalytic [Tanacetum cinerariifolium]